MNIEQAIAKQFAFALRNGGAKLSIGGKTVDAIAAEPRTTTGDLRRGRNRTVRTQTVGVLRSDIPTRPEPGTKASLDGWPCVVAEEGVDDSPFVWEINLRSPS